MSAVGFADARPNGRLGLMLAGLGDLAATFIGGVMLLRKGKLEPAGSVTQADAGWLAADAGVPPGTLSQLLRLPPLDNLAFGAWSIFPDNATEVARVWTLFEPQQFEAVEAELGTVKPLKAVFDAMEVTDGTSGTFIKVMTQNKSELAAALEEDLDAFEKQNGCPSVVLFCGAPEEEKELSESHAGADAFEAGLRANDPAITSSQIYAWVCARRGTPFACAVANRAIGFPALELRAQATGAPLAGNGLRQASYRVLDIASPAIHEPNAAAPCWWQEPLRPEVSEEVKNSKFAVSIMADRETVPIEADKRASPALLDVALLLDAAWQRRWGGTQQWLDIFFSAPASPRADIEEDTDFRDTLIRMIRNPAANRERR